MASQIRHEGFTRPQGHPPEDLWNQPVSETSLDQLLTRSISGIQKQLRENAYVYANARIAKGAAPTPQCILSNVGFIDRKDPFTWAYLPPNAGGYSATPQGFDRPWSYIMIHSFGYSWDQYQLGVPTKRTQPPGGYKQRLTPPGDAYGHHPTRWMAGIRQLCGQEVPHPKALRTSIHFCISRRGDVVVSCDLNDVAYHGGGDLRIHPRGNNYVTVGFELEPALARQTPGGAISLVPYTDRQMLALALVCKKLNTIRPIARVLISKKLGSIREQISAAPSGYIQHLDVNSQKLDARGQFDILPGQKGTTGWLKGVKSGWDQLWELMDRVRSFDLATDVFAAAIPDMLALNSQQLGTLMRQATSLGERLMVQTSWDRQKSYVRAASMQTQTRKTHYGQALGQTAVLNDIVGKVGAAIAQVATSFSTSTISPLKGEALAFNFTEGTWMVGTTNTGQQT